jgi:alpha-ribazole phosphatase
VTARALHLLRHGAPDLPGRLLGRTDAAPTPEGIAACLAQAATLDVTRIVSSDMQRTHRAAEAIAAARTLPLTIDPRWRELDFGAWDGLATDTIDPASLAAFWDDPDAHPPPAGERWSMLASRVGAALDSLAAEPVLVVTHGGAIRAALHVLCGIAQRETWALALPYAARVSLHVWPGERPNAQIMALVP